MSPAIENISVSTVLRGAAAALLFAAAMMQPRDASAASGGRDGARARTVAGHGGGFHGHGRAFHGHHGSENFRAGFGLGGTYVPYWWGYGYPYFSYGYEENSSDHQYSGYDPACSYYGTCPDNGYGSRPSARQSRYYCPDPAGYYPYVAQCKGGWQAVPAS